MSLKQRVKDGWNWRKLYRDNPYFHIVEEKLEKPEKPKRKTIKLKTEHEAGNVL